MADPERDRRERLHDDNVRNFLGELVRKEQEGNLTEDESPSTKEEKWQTAGGNKRQKKLEKEYSTAVKKEARTHVVVIRIRDFNGKRVTRDQLLTGIVKAAGVPLTMAHVEDGIRINAKSNTVSVLTNDQERAQRYAEVRSFHVQDKRVDVYGHGTTPDRYRRIVLPKLLNPETEVDEATCGLRLLRLDVPSIMRRGEQTWLNCSYDLERDQLYSIKWYKNNVEIYRYLPSETPRVKVYNMPGIHIDVSRSNISDLYLNDTDLNSEGKYRCEVSAESPSFQTERAQKEMIVYVLPYEDPVIKGLYSQYQLGDLVNLTCSYGPSKPNASLTWYINDRKVPTASEEAIHRTQYVDGEGLSYVQSRISFVAQPGHFWHGSMEIRCASHAALPYYVSSEELTIRDYGRTVDISGPRMNGPRLDGKKDKYTLGNVVDLSCNADGEAPIHGLKWLINDREAQDSYVSYSPPHGPGSTASTVLKLHFRLGEQHFSKGELRLKCVSKQLREFTAASEYRVPISDKRQSSGLQVSFSRSNGSSRHLGFLWALALVQILSRIVVGST